MRRIAIALTLSAGCFDEPPDGKTVSTTGDASTTADDESSSSDVESSSSGAMVVEPLGPCEADPSCHCVSRTCVPPCSTDAQCPGTSTCIDQGCYQTCLQGVVIDNPSCEEGQLCEPWPLAGDGPHICTWP
jgi:hypothetical protein